MCSVLLPPGGYPTAVNKYIILATDGAPPLSSRTVKTPFDHCFLGRKIHCTPQQCPKKSPGLSPLDIFAYELSGTPALFHCILDAADHVERRPNESRELHTWFTGVSRCVLRLRVLIFGTFNTFNNQNLCMYWLIYSWFNTRTTIIP